jgi:hypothetical protein
MEPRSYSAVPLGTNFVVAGYARSTGDVSLDPSLPILLLHNGQRNSHGRVGYRHASAEISRPSRSRSNTVGSIAD